MTIKPRLLPAGACDTHMHVFDRRFRALPGAMYREATANDYLASAREVGIDRAVIVQPSGYGFDNRCTLDALARFGSAARAIVVIPPDTTAPDVQRLDAAGVRGVRFMPMREGMPGWDDLMPTATAIAPLGWHVNLQFDGKELPERLALLRGLPCPCVIDHVGAFVGGTTVDSPAFDALLALLDTGRAWVKLSGPYTYGMSRTGAPDYPEVGMLARALLRAFPQRCVWASDWPHVSEPKMLSGVDLLRVARGWAPDASSWRAITVDNPARLYGFDLRDILPN